MNKEQPVNEFDDNLRPEYDFANMAGGVRGKYVDSLAETQRERYRSVPLQQHFQFWGGR